MAISREYLETAFPNDFHSILMNDMAAGISEYKPETIRHLVDLYYQMQEYRIRAESQTKEGAEANGVISVFMETFRKMEKSIADLLTQYCKFHPVGQWLLAQYGVSGVLASRLLAELDAKDHPYAGHFWSFAGLAPDKEWKKGQTRPYNAKLKSHMWKIASSFKIFSGRENCDYGRLYRKRKEFEIAKNLNGENKEYAEKQASKRRYGADLKALLESGTLPDGQIDLRAMRYVEKIFLSHLHTVMYWVEYGELPPAPFAMKYGGHDGYLMIPHADIVPGLEEALKAQYGGLLKRM